MKVFSLSLIFLLSFNMELNSQSTASKQVSTFTIEAPQLNTFKKIWVYLPKSYQTSKKRYPVIYMHDAQNLFDAETSYGGEWKVDEYLDTITNYEVIVIGIEHGNEKRIDELTPYINEQYGGGKGDLYLTFIINTLKPHIDTTYKTLKDPNNTTIFGSSIGGLISFYAVIKFPQTFGNAGVFSPSFWFNPEIFDFTSEVKISTATKFFFLMGTEESETALPNLTKMIALLKEKGIMETHINNKIVEGGKHNEGFGVTIFRKLINGFVKNDLK